jgi:alpha/beta hydrolase fold
MRTISVNGQHLRVAVRPGNGTRTPLLLMNGFGVNLEVLKWFVNALDPAIEVIRFDVPGTGGSPAPLIPYRFSKHAWLVTKMLDQLGYWQIDALGVSCSMMDIWDWGRVHMSSRRSLRSFSRFQSFPQWEVYDQEVTARV